MSRGLGEMQRNIMNIVTYDNIVGGWVNVREIIQIYASHNGLAPEMDGKTIEEKIEFFYCHEENVPFLYWRFNLQDSLDKEGKVFYQSLMRAIRSLEKKGFILTRMEDISEIGDDENKPTKEITFNPKCLSGGIPWQLKYLNKRLRGKND